MRAGSSFQLLMRHAGSQPLYAAYTQAEGTASSSAGSGQVISVCILETFTPFYSLHSAPGTSFSALVLH